MDLLEARPWGPFRCTDAGVLMTDQIISGIVVVITAIIGVALIAVLVSKGAQTGNVLTSGGSALSSVIKAAVSPVTSGGLVSGGTIPSLPTFGQ